VNCDITLRFRLSQVLSVIAFCARVCEIAFELRTVTWSNFRDIHRWNGIRERRFINWYRILKLPFSYNISCFIMHICYCLRLKHLQENISGFGGYPLKYEVYISRLLSLIKQCIGVNWHITNLGWQKQPAVYLRLVCSLSQRYESDFPTEPTSIDATKSPSPLTASQYIIHLSSLWCRSWHVRSGKFSSLSLFRFSTKDHRSENVRHVYTYL
jgi:hypothetical protein